MSGHAFPSAKSDDADGLGAAREAGDRVNPEGSTSRVDVTDEAAQMLRRLAEKHGPLMFHQSGGCCDGSSPMCFAEGDFITSDADVQLGTIDAGTGQPIDVWMSREQFQLWKHTHLTIDLVKGRGAGFSLEGPTGYRFLIRSRLFTEDEYRALGESAGDRVQPQVR